MTATLPDRIRREGDQIHIIDRDQLLRVAVGLLSPTSSTGPEGTI